MIIRRRDKALNVTRAQREEKALIVLEWLSEFRASNAILLAKRLGIAVSNTHKLLGDMQEQGLVLSFENIHTRGLRLFALGQTGIQKLEAWGIDTANAVTKTSNLARKTTIIHDLCVQRLGLDLMEQYQCSEILWDKNIKTESRVRPDLIIVKPDGNKAAIEFDRTPKGQPHFYERLSANYESIHAGHYHAVIIAADSDATIARYKGLFDAPEWPVIRKNEEGTLVRLSATITPTPSVRNRIQWMTARNILSEVLSSRLHAGRLQPSGGREAISIAAQ